MEDAQGETPKTNSNMESTTSGNEKRKSHETLSPSKRRKKEDEVTNIQKEESKFYNKKVTLSNCDREPIHIIGQIQHQGFLFAVDEQYIIRHTTTNLPTYLGYEPSEVIGTSLHTIMPRFNYTFDVIREYSKDAQYKEIETEAINKEKNSIYVHCCVHVNSNGFLLIEGETTFDDSFEYGLRISKLFNQFSENDDLLSLLNIIGNEIRQVTGYSRVMIYEFDEDFNGKVIVESTDLDARFLNLHFPSTDIPQQARELFRKNRFRIIQDALKPAADILPRTNPIDLSYCTMRGISPMHLLYMKNMGVRASMTISILIGVEKKFWGLITCHHTGEPKNISYSRRRYCDLLGRLISTQVENILQRREMSKRLKLEQQISVTKESLVLLDMDSSPYETLYKLFPGWATVLNCDGILLRTDDRNFAYGPVGRATDNIVQWASTHLKTENYFICESIKELSLECDDGLCCGFMYVKLQNAANNSAIYFFRNEYVRSIVWGGEPKKADTHGILNPRSSFTQWKQVMRGKCLRWDPMSLEYANQIQAMVTRYIFRWTAEKLRTDAEKEKEAVEKLIRENEITRQAAILHNNFLATVSHELRTPIHSILGNTERLTDLQNMTADAQHACKMIRSSSEHLLAIISDILDLSKLESSKLEIHPIPFDFYKKMDTIAHSLYSVASNKGLYLNLLVPVGIPLLMADATRVGQIILNYMSNAIKFTTTGGITVEVQLLNRTKNNVTIKFIVRDTGVGISEVDSRKLFERFSQLENGRARKYEGTGLGLSINKQLAELMGGQVGVDSELSSGSSFWVQIDLAIVSGEVDKYPYQINKSRVGDILVVESRQFVKDWLDHHMKQWNLQFELLDGAASLMSRINAKTYAVFLSLQDMNVKEMESTIEAIKKAFPSIIVAIIDSDGSSPNKISTHYDALMMFPLSFLQLHQTLTGASANIAHSDAMDAETSTEKFHVLVVEDNKTNQMIAQAFLNSLGHSMDIVDNGLEAIRAISSNSYDAVLMDVMMPIMDGITATIQIRNLERSAAGGVHLPIVGLTAAGESSLLDECLVSGMDACLSKPFKKVELRDMLINVMKRFPKQVGSV